MKSLKREYIEIKSSSDSEHETSCNIANVSDASSARHWDGLSCLTPFSYDGISSHSRGAQYGNTCLSFRQILGPQQCLKSGIMSAMCIDWQWLETQFSVAIDNQAPLLIIADYERHSSPGIKSHPRIDAWRICFPPFYGTFYGKMHSKLMLLFFEDLNGDKWLRVVISSANLMAYDYQQVQNIVFLQDFPFSTSPSRSAKGDAFKFELERHLRSMKVPSTCFSSLEKFDFCKAAAWIVSSVPGNYTMKSMGTNLVGLFHLSSQMATFLDSIGRPNITQFEFLMSSIGTLTDVWIHDILNAMQGTLTAAVASTATSNRSSKSSFTDGTQNQNFCIVYPTLKMVRQSVLGLGGFGTIFLSRKALEAKSFPRGKLCKSSSSQSPNGETVALHCKIFSLWDSQHQLLGMYHGSHNLSSAAWGNITKSREKMMIRNYELGVIIASDTMSSLIPYKSPPQPYDTDDVPWIQEEHL